MISRNSRPVIEKEDLQRVFTRDTGPGLHAQALAGTALLAYLGAQSEDLRAVRMSWLLAFKPSKEIYSRERAEEFMRAEEARWVGSAPGPSFADELERLSGRYLSEVSDQRKDANTKSDSLVKNVREPNGVVFGHWQFSLDSNELVDAAAAEETELEDGTREFEHHWVTRPLHDFSRVLPELWIMDLM